MNVCIDYNGWRKVVDIDPGTVRSGRIVLSVMPPMTRVDCSTAKPSPNDTAVQLVVFATAEHTPQGYQVFRNDP
jgi:hypothetical protein